MKAWCRTCQREREVPFRDRVPADRGCPVCGSMLVSTLERDRTSRATRRRTARRKPSLSSKPRERIWIPARAKVEQEGVCRLARMEDCSTKLETAHVIGRDRDQFPPLDPAWLEEWLHADTRGRWLVVPDRIAVLCSRHHRLYDLGQVGLLGRLFIAEELQAVRDSSTTGTTESGIELARIRIEAPAYRESKAA